MIDGKIHVMVIRVEGGVVKLGIEAPAEVRVHRQEVHEAIERNKRALDEVHGEIHQP